MNAQLSGICCIQVSYDFSDGNSPHRWISLSRNESSPRRRVLLAIQLAAAKPVCDSLNGTSDANTRLKRTLGPIELVLLGVGAIVGVGIFVLTGQAAAMYAGPGVVISCYRRAPLELQSALFLITPGFRHALTVCCAARQQKIAGWQGLRCYWERQRH
jgi:hypothetical protein